MFQVWDGFVLEVGDNGLVLRASLNRSNATVLSVKWSSDSRFIAQGTTLIGATTVYINEFDGALSANLGTFNHGANTNSVDWHPSAGQLAIGGDTNGSSLEVQVLSVNSSGVISGTAVDTFDHGDNINSVAWRPDGDYLAIGGVAGSDLGDGETAPQVRVIPWDGSAFGTTVSFTHGAEIESVDWSPNGKYLAIGGASGTGTGTPEFRVLEFDGTSLTVLASFDYIRTPVRSVSWYPDGKSIAICGEQALLNQFNFYSLAFDPVSTALAVNFSEAIQHTTNGADLFAVDVRPNLAHDVNLAITNCHTLMVNDICPIMSDECSPDLSGTTKFSGNVSASQALQVCGDLSVVRTATKTSKVVLGGQTDSAGDFSEMRVLDGSNGTQLATADHDNTEVFTVRWRRDGEYYAMAGAAIAGADQIKVFDKNGIEIAMATFASVSDVDWSADGAYVVTVGGALVGVWEFDADAGTLTSVQSSTLVDSVGVALPSAEQLQVSPDGTHLIVGEASETVHVYSFAGGFVASPAVDSEAVGFPATSINSLGWSPDNKFIALGQDVSVASELIVIEFDVSAGTLSITGLVGLASATNAVAFAPVLIGGASYLASHDGTDLTVYSVVNGGLSLIDTEAVGTSILSIAWDSTAENIIIATADEVRSYAFDPTLGNEIVSPATWTFDHGGTVNSVDVFGPTTAKVAVITNDGDKWLTNKIGAIDECGALDATGTTTFCSNVTIADGKTLSVSTITCFQQVLIGGSNSSLDGKELRVLDGADGTFLRSGDHSAVSLSARYSPNGAFIASGGTDTFLRIYNNDPSTTDLSLLDSFDQGGPVRTVDWSPDGSFVAIGSDSGGATGGFEIRVIPWDGSSLGTPITFDSGTTRVRTVAWSPDGNFLAFSDDTSPQVEVLEFDGVSLTSVETFAHNTLIAALDWSPNGAYLAIGGNSSLDDGFDLRVLEWDKVSTTLTLVTSYEHSAFAPAITSVAWSPSGQHIAFGSGIIGGPEVGVLEFDAGIPSLTLVATFEHGARVDSVAWYPDGTRIAMAGDTSSSVNVRGLTFDPDASEPLTSFFDIDHGAPVNSVDVSSSGLCIDCDTTQFKNNVEICGDLNLKGCVTEDFMIEPDNKLLVNFIDPVMIDESTGECIEDPNGTTCFSGNVAVDENKKLLVNEINPVMIDSLGNCVEDVDGTTNFSGNVNIDGTLTVTDFAGIGPTGPAGPTGPQGPAGADGADGADGAQGPTGPAGADGADGPTGPQGPAGADGADGADGAQGPTGSPGVGVGDLSCVEQTIGIDPSFGLLTNEIFPVDVDTEGNCIEDPCGRIVLGGCEVEVLGKLFARNFKLLCPPATNPCGCDFGNSFQCPKCIKIRSVRSLDKITEMDATGEIDDLGAFISDMVSAMQSMSLRIEELETLVTAH